MNHDYIYSEHNSIEILHVTCKSRYKYSSRNFIEENIHVYFKIKKNDVDILKKDQCLFK